MLFCTIEIRMHWNQNQKCQTDIYMYICRLNGEPFNDDFQIKMFSMIYLIYHQCLAKYVLITKARSCMYISVRDDKNSEFKLKKN